MARLRDVLIKAPIIDTLLVCNSKKVRNATLELISSSLNVTKSELKSVLLSDIPKYSDIVSKIEQKNRTLLLSWVDLAYRTEKPKSKWTLIHGGVYPIIISILVTAAFLYFSTL